MKKLLCIIVSLVMLLSCTAPSFAAGTEEHLPQIYVNGIGTRAVYEVDDPDKTPLFFPIDNEGLMENIGNITGYIESAVKKNKQIPKNRITTILNFVFMLIFF